MAFLHCHKCNWEQDDFWDKNGYNPFRQDIVDWLKECLFRDLMSYYDNETGREIELSGQEVVARELEQKVRSIRNMHWKTYDEWTKVRDVAKCPKCGQRKWDID